MYLFVYYCVDKCVTMCYYVFKRLEEMNTRQLSIRIPVDLIALLDKIAQQKEWSRNYVIHKFLKEKSYELAQEIS